MTAELNKAGLAGLMAEREPHIVDNPSFLIDPVDCKIVDIEDADSLIDSLETANEANATLQAWRGTVKRHLANMRADNTTKTQRVRGTRRIVKVVNQSDYVSSPILAEAWNSYPQFREEFLKVSKYAIRVREFKKAIATTGEPDFNTFCKIVSSAITPNEGIPAITIEEVKSDGESKRSE